MKQKEIDIDLLMKLEKLELAKILEGVLKKAGFSKSERLIEAIDSMVRLKGHIRRFDNDSF